MAGTKCGLDFFGVDQVLFASDVPFEPSPGLYIRETIRVIEALDLDPESKEKIYRGNALSVGNAWSCPVVERPSGACALQAGPDGSAVM